MGESADVRLARIEEKFKGMASDISEIKILLKGNGQPGLVKKISDLETKFAEFNGGKKMAGAILGSSLFTGIIFSIASKVFN